MAFKGQVEFNLTYHRTHRKKEPREDKTTGEARGPEIKDGFTKANFIP